MPNITDGIYDIFDDYLGLSKDERFGTSLPKFQSLTASRVLSQSKGPLNQAVSSPENIEVVFEKMIAECMERLDSNLEIIGADHVSQSNWRWMKSLELASHNPSPEKRLEKLIAFLLDKNWVNQVSVCNGIGPTACRIDLAHRLGETEYELIELKYADTPTGGSDYPLYAAMEMLRYAMIYLLFRKHNLPMQQSGEHHLLKAKEIHLVVLAPESWYCDSTNNKDSVLNFGWLELALSHALQRYIDQEKSLAVDSMSFRFEGISEQFQENYRQMISAIENFRDHNLGQRSRMYS